MHARVSEFSSLVLFSLQSKSKQDVNGRVRVSLLYFQTHAVCFVCSPPFSDQLLVENLFLFAAGEATRGEKGTEED